MHFLVYMNPSTNSGITKSNLKSIKRYEDKVPLWCFYIYVKPNKTVHTAQRFRATMVRCCSGWWEPRGLTAQMSAWPHCSNVCVRLRLSFTRTNSGIFCWFSRCLISSCSYCLGKNKQSMSQWICFQPVSVVHLIHHPAGPVPRQHFKHRGLKGEYSCPRVQKLCQNWGIWP